MKHRPGRLVSLDSRFFSALEDALTTIFVPPRQGQWQPAARRSVETRSLAGRGATGADRDDIPRPLGQFEREARAIGRADNHRHFIRRRLQVQDVPLGMDIGDRERGPFRG